MSLVTRHLDMWYIIDICRKNAWYAWDKFEKYLRHAWGKSEKYLRYALHKPEISLRFVWYVPEICLLLSDISLINARYMREISYIYTWDIPRCPGRNVCLVLDPGAVQLWQFLSWSRFHYFGESGLVQISLFWKSGLVQNWHFLGIWTSWCRKFNFWAGPDFKK